MNNEKGKKYMNIETYRDILTDENYLYFLHGTGAATPENQGVTIKGIFQNGLLVNLSPTDPTPALRNTSCFYGDGNAFESEWDKNIESMSNWQFKGSKNIVIVRLPKEFHLHPDDKCDTLGGEEAYCYTNEQGETFVQPSLVVGCYFSQDKSFTINPNFEVTPSKENVSLWTERHAKLSTQEETLDADVSFGVKISPRATEEIVTDPQFDRPLTLDDTDGLFE